MYIKTIASSYFDISGLTKGLSFPEANDRIIEYTSGINTADDFNLVKLACNLILHRSGFGLKSITITLSLTPDLSPGLINNITNRALAQNLFIRDC